jgi:hypothetical protein
MFYSAFRQSNLPEALECRSVRFSVREMNTLIEPLFSHFKLDFIFLVAWQRTGGRMTALRGSVE